MNMTDHTQKAKNTLLHIIWHSCVVSGVVWKNICQSLHSKTNGLFYKNEISSRKLTVFSIAFVVCPSINDSFLCDFLCLLSFNDSVAAIDLIEIEIKLSCRFCLQGDRFLPLKHCKILFHYYFIVISYH